jgi:hypothetical protein|tara:strand:+ start:1955 stop:2593 length:639 start_codon:yes stop_codon:yes gene_type:complete
MFTGDFFVRQQSNQCGLHAIQNMFRSAAVSKNDMHKACQQIFEETGDPITNHESLGGDWSVAAVVTAIKMHGYDVERAVSSRENREWVVDSFETLLENQDFRGMIIHQPINRHFTCVRPEEIDGERQLFYVDSQSSGPLRISTKLAKRRCLSKAYSWEPYVVMGDEMDFVAPPQQTSILEATTEMKQRPKMRPSDDFMTAWNSLSDTPARTQ